MSKKKKKQNINDIIRKKMMSDAYDITLARFYKTDRREQKGYKRAKSKENFKKEGYDG